MQFVWLKYKQLINVLLLIIYLLNKDSLINLYFLFVNKELENYKNENASTNKLRFFIQ